VCKEAKLLLYGWCEDILSDIFALRCSSVCVKLSDRALQCAAVEFPSATVETDERLSCDEKPEQRTVLKLAVTAYSTFAM
jgi:hypothetical protein